MEFRNNVTLQG